MDEITLTIKKKKKNNLDLIRLSKRKQWQQKCIRSQKSEARDNNEILWKEKKKISYNDFLISEGICAENKSKIIDRLIYFSIKTN